MKLKESEDDITESGCDAIVNTVNCVGVMGGGVAKAIKEKYPWCLPPYKDACEKEMLQPGGIFVVTLEVEPIIEYPTIINMATKDHWRGKTRIEWVEAGLRNLSSLLTKGDFTKVAMPRPGCGLGGLNWEDVRPLVEQHLGDLECEVTIFNKPSAQDILGSSTQVKLEFKEE